MRCVKCDIRVQQNYNLGICYDIRNDLDLFYKETQIQTDFYFMLITFWTLELKWVRWIFFFRKKCNPYFWFYFSQLEFDLKHQHEASAECKKQQLYIVDNINIVRSKKLIKKDNLFLFIYVQEIVQLLGRVPIWHTVTVQHLRVVTI